MPEWSFEKLRPEGFFKSYLNTRIATIFCLLLALTNKSLVAWVHTGLVGDKSLYLLFAKQILEGHHPLEPLGLIDGVQNYSYNSGITSPMYSLLAVPFLWATKSYYATSFLLDVLAWTILLTGLYRFSLIALKERWVANLLVLCAGFFLYPHELGSGPKDSFSIGCLLWICVFIKGFVDQPGIRKSLLLSFLLIFVGLMKFLYSPLTLVFITLLWMAAFKIKRRQHVIHATIISLICFIAFFCFYFYLEFLKELHFANNIEPAGNVTHFQKGFYPENIKHIFPFISSAILNINFWCVQLSDILNLPFQTVGRGFQFFDLILIIPTVLFLRSVLKKERDVTIWQTGIAISLAILFMLVYMSVTNTLTYVAFETKWTYVQEARSYLFIILFLQVALFYLIFYSSAAATLKNFLLLLFIIECLHGFYFTAKQLTNKLYTIEAGNSNAVEKTVSFFQKANASASFAYLSTPDPHLRYYAQLHNIPVVSFSHRACRTIASSMDQPLIVALYRNSSFNTTSCLTGKTLVTTDTISPFVLKLYVNQNYSR